MRIALPATHPLAASTGPVGLIASDYADIVVATCNERGGFQPDVRYHATDLLIVLALVRSDTRPRLLPDLLGADRDPAVDVRDVTGGPLARTSLTAVRESSLDRPGLA